MWGRQQTGSVLCRSCGGLTGVSDEACFHCGARNPGLFGFAARLRSVGADLGFGPLILSICVLAYGMSLALDPEGIGFQGLNLLSPQSRSGSADGLVGHLPGLGERSVVDRPVRGLAARQPSAHLLQYVLGPHPRSSGGRALRPRPDRDRLHPRFDRRLRDEFGGARRHPHRRAVSSRTASRISRFSVSSPSARPPRSWECGAPSSTTAAGPVRATCGNGPGPTSCTSWPSAS